MSSTGVVDNCLKIPVPVLNLHMMSNEEELELIEECKRKHPERYTVGQRIEGDANDKLFFRPLKNRPRSLGANGRLTAIIRHIIGEY